MTKTPTRSLRVPDDLWTLAVEKAAREGLTMTQVINQLLKEWVK